MDALKIALQYLINIIVWAIIIKSVCSWFPGASDSRAYKILDDFTEPIERPVRNIFGRFMNGPLDFTPMIAIFILYFIGRIISIFL